MGQQITASRIPAGIGKATLASNGDRAETYKFRTISRWSVAYSTKISATDEPNCHCPHDHPNGRVKNPRHRSKFAA